MRSKKHGTVGGHQEERYRSLLRAGQGRIASSAHGIGHCVKNETRRSGCRPENKAKHQGIWAPQPVDAVGEVGHQQRPQGVQNSHSYGNGRSRSGHENRAGYSDCGSDPASTPTPACDQGAAGRPTNRVCHRRRSHLRGDRPAVGGGQATAVTVFSCALLRAGRIVSLRTGDLPPPCPHP